jgi:ABC-type multidrug transport system fused ATPase/permease subunit
MSMARALYRDAPMLLLDEATSSLDSTSENEIGEMLQSLRVNRTVLIVAHRAGALRHCDIVYELAAGKIVGQHSRLSPVSRQAGNG